MLCWSWRHFICNKRTFETIKKLKTYQITFLKLFIYWYTHRNYSSVQLKKLRQVVASTFWVMPMRPILSNADLISLCWSHLLYWVVTTQKVKLRWFSTIFQRSAYYTKYCADYKNEGFNTAYCAENGQIRWINFKKHQVGLTPYSK